VGGGGGGGGGVGVGGGGWGGGGFSGMLIRRERDFLPSLVIPEDLVKANFLGSPHLVSYVSGQGAAIGGAVAGLSETRQRACCG